ncbi:MAG: aminotransferase class III-fold pyridoxal phosphate-dependent enzyme, partial [Paracoccaceae bacterium]
AGYFQRIREICDQYGVLLILDEVMCGMGRTGHLFACEAEGITPDILCIAKGLGAGYQPIGAMLCSGQVYETLGAGSGFFQHGHTYVGHPVVCAAGQAVLSAIVERDLLTQVKARSEDVFGALRAQFGQHAHIGDIRGRGLFIGLELVADRTTKAPFDPSLRIAARIKAAAFDAGLICYPMAGTRDGQQGDHILLAPPFILDDAGTSELVDKLALAVKALVP